MISTRKNLFGPGIAKSQQGFSLIEVMISMAIMTIGLVSLLGVFGLAMAATQTSQDNAVAKQLADEAIEGILTARETANIPWASIQNTGAGGIFLPGFQAISRAGADGIIGTADDAAAGPETLQLPGPDGIFGTADDVNLSLTNYQRQIVVAPVLDNTGNIIQTVRSVTVTVQYFTPQTRVPKNYILTTFISSFR